MVTDADRDPMPAGMPERHLKAVRALEHTLGQVRVHLCPCGRDAVVFPPPACVECGGLGDLVRNAR